MSRPAAIALVLVAVVAIGGAFALGRATRGDAAGATVAAPMVDGVGATALASDGLAKAAPLPALRKPPAPEATTSAPASGGGASTVSQMSGSASAPSTSSTPQGSSTPVTPAPAPTPEPSAPSGGDAPVVVGGGTE